jgi:hypothetical protein
MARSDLSPLHTDLKENGEEAHDETNDGGVKETSLAEGPMELVSSRVALATRMTLVIHVRRLDAFRGFLPYEEKVPFARAEFFDLRPRNFESGFG